MLPKLACCLLTWLPNHANTWFGNTPSSLARFVEGLRPLHSGILVGQGKLVGWLGKKLGRAGGKAGDKAADKRLGKRGGRQTVPPHLMPSFSSSSLRAFRPSAWCMAEGLGFRVPPEIFSISVGRKR